jgi:rhodanese-related sulfurtransferase
MLKRLVVIVALSTAAFAQEASKPADGGAGGHHGPATHAKQLTNQEFDTYLAHPEQVLVVDVRRPDEVSSIGGFPVYLSIQAKDLKNHIGEIPKDRSIITVSNHAARASVAADLLEANGFKVLGAIGADTYQKTGGTLAVKIPVPPANAAGANSQPATPGSN